DDRARRAAYEPAERQRWRCRRNYSFSRSYEPADPAARRVAIPQDAVADVQPVRLRIVSGELDRGHGGAVLRIELVHDSPVGLDAPQEPAIPREAVRPYARRWNRPDDLAALRLHQEEFPGGRDCHPVLVVDPLQAVAARRCRDTPVQPGSWRDPRLQRLSTRRVDFQGTRRRRRIAHLRRGNPERVVSPGDAAAVNGLGLQLADHRAIVGPDLERLVGIDLVEYPESVADELQVVRLRRT